MNNFLGWYMQALTALLSTEPKILDAICHVESKGNPDVISSENCHGQYQINPRYTPLPEWALHVPELSRAEAARHLVLWKKKTKGDTVRALAAYNCGNRALKSDCGQGYARRVLSLARKGVRPCPSTSDLKKKY